MFLKLAKKIIFMEEIQANVPLRQSIPLDSKKIIKKTIVSTVIFFVVVLALAYPIASVFFVNIFGFQLFSLSTIVLVSLVSLAICFFVAFLYQRAYFNSYFYDIKNDFLVIKKGVFTPKETTLPFEKITDVYVDRDIFDVVFGLFDVHVSTPTVISGLAAHIDGVSAENAEKLKNVILQNVQTLPAYRQ
jgi:putative membrane protein